MKLVAAVRMSAMKLIYYVDVYLHCTYHMYMWELTYMYVYMSACVGIVLNVWCDILLW